MIYMYDTVALMELYFIERGGKDDETTAGASVAIPGADESR